ncbi:MAG TPA: tetratricopeptide repeat protein [Candidatus Angelobacter sp.]|nr:tetratricopeptide repeat protein [Candidatus Angelobacter sp.]
MILCGLAPALAAQESQDNQPHIQPQREAPAPKPEKKRPQPQPSPDQQQSPDGAQQSSPLTPDSAGEGESSSRDSEINLNAGTRAALPIPADESKDDGGFKPYDPHRAMKDLEVGNFYLKQKNYRAALERFNDALRYKPNDAQATYALAYTQEKMDLLEQSRKNYSKYLELLPQGPHAKDCEEGLKRVEARLQEVSEQNGSGQQAAENIAIGETFLARNDYYSARQRFEAAVRLAPDNPTACFRLAQSLRGLQQLEPARLYYQKYLELDPKGTFAADARKAVADITYIVGK